MARSDDTYRPDNTNFENTAMFGTAKYWSDQATYWLRSAKWWKQFAWVMARRGDELRFADGMTEYHNTREKYLDSHRRAHEIGAKIVEPVLE